jgi:phospholipase D1/2
LVKRVLVLVAVAAVLGLLWAFSPLREAVDPERLLAHAQTLRANPVAPLVVAVVFVVLSLLLVPMFVLRVTIVLAFGPLLGPIYAMLAVALAALVGHALGRRVGAAGLERVGGPRVQKIRARLQRCGVWSIAALRMVPLGPNMLVNAVAGAAKLPRRAFIAGTVIGMLPGVLVLAGLGAQIESLIR